MNDDISVVIHDSPDVLAAAVAARLITRIADAQAKRGAASVALTGGRIGIATLRSVATSPARDAVDWSALDVWWGDERFLPPGDPERNETQAREALLDHVAVEESRIHAMPASGADDDTSRVGGGPDVDVVEPEAAAERYATTLGETRPGTPSGASFDVVMLGVGPDGHVASLFPEHTALRDERAIVAVHNAPKPPPTRVSMSLATVGDADEVWLIVAGDDKAAAVRSALRGADPLQIPAAGARGRHATRWLLDRAAASDLPGK